MRLEPQRTGGSHSTLFGRRAGRQAEQVAEEVDIRRLVSQARRWPSLLVIVAGLAVGAAACSSENATTTSKASATTTTTTGTTSPTTTLVTNATTTTAATTTAAPTATTVTTTTTTLTTSSPQPARDLLVPVHSAPTIDGSLETGEWEGAAVGEMSDGTPVYLMHDGESLFVAVDGEHLGAINLAIAGPEDVWVLHSSAALGSTRYVSSGSEWDLSRDFDWCCRDADDPTDRLALLDAEGWQATIGYTGEPGTVEYQVTLPWVGSRAAISAQTRATEPAFWPAELSPDAQMQLIGPWSPTRNFRLGEWPTLLPDEP